MASKADRERAAKLARRRARRAELKAERERAAKLARRRARRAELKAERERAAKLARRRARRAEPEPEDLPARKAPARKLPPRGPDGQFRPAYVPPRDARGRFLPGEQEIYRKDGGLTIRIHERFESSEHLAQRLQEVSREHGDRPVYAILTLKKGKETKTIPIPLTDALTFDLDVLAWMIDETLAAYKHEGSPASVTIGIPIS